MNREGCTTLAVFSLIALAISALVYFLSAYACGKTAGLICGGIAAFLTVTMLCSAYTGANRE